MDEGATANADQAAIMRRIDELGAELADLRAEIGADVAVPPETRRDPPAAGRTPMPEAVTEARTVDRRALLGKAGATAVGAIAATAAVSLVDAPPAAAENASFFTSFQAQPAITADVVEDTYALPAIHADGGTAGMALWATGQTTTASDPLQAVILAQNGATSGNAAAIVARAGQADQGWGVLGAGSHIGLEGQGDHWDVRATRSATLGFTAPTSGVRHGPGGDAVANTVGDVSFDGGNLWLCTATGSGPAATFRKVSGPNVAGSLHLLAAPTRAYDSRLGGETALDNAQRSVNCRLIGPGLPGQGRGTGVPQNAVAVVVNLTATNTSDSGWLAIWSDGIAWPGHSNLNWSASGSNVANQCTTACTAQGGVLVKSASLTNFLIDVIGYYR